MRIYACLFLIALATLGFEISLSRLMSIITWYHLGFFAISVAMLGMTSGAIAVLFNEKKFDSDGIIRSAQKGCLAFALTIPLAALVLAYVQIPVSLVGSQFLVNLARILFVTVMISLPFFFSGIVISALLTLSTKPVHRLYAADLIGAATGCISVAVVLSLTDTVTAALVFALVGILAAFLLFEQARFRKLSLGVLGLCSLLFIAISAQAPLLKLQHIKGQAGNVIGNALTTRQPVDIERWNSFSRIAVSDEFTWKPIVWSADAEMIEQYQAVQRYMDIDGGAGTTIRRYHAAEDVEHLQYDVTNIAYFLRDPGSVGVIGVGGAKDLQAALWFGNTSVTGIELNPIFIDLLQNEFRDFAGIAARPEVKLIVDEARSYLSHNTDRYDLLQMSLIDTWAATGAGAFSLSENGLYTLEAWQVFYRRLSDHGLFTVSRWYNPDNLGETARMLSLAVETLLSMGIEAPNQHIALVANQVVASLILSRQPLSAAEIATLERESARLKHTVLIAPDRVPSDPLIADIVNAKRRSDIQAISDRATFNVTAPTDQSPYFFNMLKLGNLNLATEGGLFKLGVISGNLKATITLLMLIGILGFLTIPAILVPTWLFQRSTGQPMGVYWPSALFFMLIGSGFMALEIGLLQRLSVYLGHPVYALSVLLFGIILSTGVGSLLSERLPRHNKLVMIGLGAFTALTILVLESVVNRVIEQTIIYAMPLKILCTLAILIPTGVLLGCFFPTGLSIAKANGEELAAPWYWALNGIFSVLFSALAVFISIYLSIATNFYLAATAYAGTAVCFYLMLSERQRQSAPLADDTQAVGFEPLPAASDAP